jgi:outer membrane protein assembly factor BamB
MLAAMRTYALAGLAGLVLISCGDPTPPPSEDCSSWRQWGNSAAHAGASCVSGQPLETTLSEMVYDPYIEQEITDAGGILVVHYQAPLIDGDDLYMMTKRGTYTPCAVVEGQPNCFQAGQLYRRHSQVWAEQRFTIGDDGTLALQWTYESDWKPPPLSNFEPMFQPALSGNRLVVPRAGGAVWEVDRVSGQVIRHVQPFGATIDPDTYVAGGLAAAPDGTIYYSAVKLDHDNPAAMPSQAWLVAVAPDGTSRTASYTTLVPGAPAADAECFGVYSTQTTPLPWPPQNPDGSVIPPPVFACGPQRPGVNATPAIGSDGTIFLVSRAHFNLRYSYVVAVNRDLSPKWATSLRDYLRDGCGVTSPSNGTETENINRCRVGTPVGLERTTGLLPAATVNDESSSSPVALPDGGVLYGSLVGYNGSRGHLFKIDGTGAIAASYDFGWDSTPAVFGDASDYKIIIKDNHYVGQGPFYITQLDSSLRPVWKFQNTSTQSCARQPDGSIACDPEERPNGFEWCINALAVDRDGTAYANNEDGHAYAIRADGTLRDRIFLDRALGAAYTPIALDGTGRVFALNNGRLAVLGARSQ